MQYLGAKHRSICKIVKECSKFNEDGYILDLFSGSTVVSQALSNAGMNVVSNDIQQFSNVFANATLQIDFKLQDIQTSLSTLENIITASTENRFYAIFKEFINKEKEYINLKSSKELLNLYIDFPVVWNRSKKKTKEIQELHDCFEQNINKSGFNIGPITTLHYAGTYFGIKQSLDIDYLRVSIEQKKENAEISSWQYNMFLTCLLTVISKVVFSAGKHFAQPVSAGGVLRTPILNQRLLIDRTFNVLELFNQTVIAFTSHCIDTNHTKDNISLNNSMEELLVNYLDLPKVDIIYADPPYTAQQYSRFYHIPEVIMEYKIPKLQIHKGSITKGIYPDNKYKSRFCSKVKVKEAFKDLFKLTKKLDSVLILSYSESKNNSTGNDRMIDLDSLDQLQKEILPNYIASKVEFDFEYRQLNKSKFIDNEKNDKEILIVYSKNNK